MSGGAPAAPLDPAAYRDLVRRALAEDLGDGDRTTEATVPAGAHACGAIRAKQACVLAGLDVALEAFRQLDPGVTAAVRRADGAVCAPGDDVAALAGCAAALLGAERTALNFLQRLSGIATLARRFVEAAAGRTTILDTRKTTPSLRVLEKYAVRVGGAVNHRRSLGDAVLIKENHARLAGSVGAAVTRARAAAGQVRIEVEARTLADVDEALAAGADVVLLDNMTIGEIGAAIARCRGRAATEVSGGVTLARVPALAALGPDAVSVGALTHSAPAADLAFDIAPAS